jgi:hypothetical protein
VKDQIISESDLKPCNELIYMKMVQVTWSKYVCSKR